MNTSLVISGYALYVFMFFFAVLAIGFIFYGCAYVKEARERGKLERRYKKLSKGYDRLLGMYQQEVCRLPVITEGTDKLPKLLLENERCKK